MAPHVLCIGGEDHALRIPFLVALRERGFRVTAAGTGDAAPFARSQISYCRYQFDRFIRPGGDRATMKQLARLVAAVSPDLVQTFDTKPNLLAPLAARGAVPVVRTINGMGWAFSSKPLAALVLRPAYCALQRLASGWTAATVFQNLEDQTYFEKRHLLGGSISRLIPGSGADVNAFDKARESASSPASLRGQLGLGTAEVVITVSRLTRQKGIPTLLKAAALVHEARPGVRFLLVGPRQTEGPLAVDPAEIERHAQYVTALGPRSDIPALLALADVFAFPTEYREGIPRVLLEGGLAGLPIVTTQMPGCSDVVTDGWNGYLVPPRDAGALAGRILDLLRDKQTARAMGHRSVDLVRREFGLATIVDRYVGLYREVLAGEQLRGKAPSPETGERGARTLGQGAAQ